MAGARDPAARASGTSPLGPQPGTNPVESTSDSSTISKLSACSAGYFTDRYLKFFVQRPLRRAPLIHWGYYVRWKAVEWVKSVCRDWLSNSVGQLILLGSGYDTSVFQLNSKGPFSGWKVFEVDFSSVQRRKLHVINQSQQLLKCTGELKSESNSLVSSVVYSAISCDICDLETLRVRLEQAGVDFTTPTLLVAEVVLTYIHATRKRHFKQLQSPLKNIDLYPTEENQRNRYLSAGWDFCKSCDMNTFFSWLPGDEKQRIKHLELFDEYEEWHLKCAHYMILCAFKGQFNILKDQIIPNCHVGDGSLHPIQKSLKLAVESSNYSLKRYGHGSCILSGGSIAIFGGYGVPYVEGTAPHSRLSDVLMLQPDVQGWKLYGPCNANDSSPGAIMHHTVTAISNGTSILVIGGRMSPASPNKHMFLLSVNGPLCDAFQWSKIVLHPRSAVMEPRWRHTAISINVNDEEIVIIIGGSCVRTCALADIYKLNIATWRLEKLGVSLPEGRCSHSCVTCWEGLMICGGMDSFMQPLSSCFHLSQPLPDVWSLSPVHFSPPIPPKYSMCAVATGDHVILVGGVGLQTTPDLIVINLPHQIWFGARILHEKDIILLEKHTCHLVAGHKLLLLGGGGNCFSFGTHFNSTIYSLDTHFLF